MICKYLYIRSTKLILFLSFIIFTFLSCGSNDSLNKNSTCNNNSNCKTLTIGDESRSFIIHIPEFYNEDNPTPLLINFHGFGGNAEDFSSDIGASDSNLHSIADTHNFIVVYPQGVERSKGDTEWYPRDNGMSSIINNDVFFTKKLIENISAEWNIDSLRIYAIGYSNGGMMAYGLACNTADMIAAVGIMSGVMLEDECNQSHKTSIIHFHGIEDEVLPYNGNQDFQSVSSIIEFWLDHNGIPSSSLKSSEFNNGDVIKDEYSDNPEQLSLTLYTINNEYDKPGGHVWFTDSINGKNPNEILWDFLSSYTLND